MSKSKEKKNEFVFNKKIDSYIHSIEILEKKIKQTPIAWISVDPNAQTGYGTQTRDVVGKLTKLGYDITCIRGGGKMGWSPVSENIIKLSNGEQITIKTLPTIGKTNGYDQWPEYKKTKKFEIVITLWDSFIIKEYANYSETAEGIHHIPIDSPMTQVFYDYLKHANIILAMSKYGYEQLIKWFPIHKIDYIPHGIDTNIYKPYSKQRKTELRKYYGLTNDNIMFISVVANAGIRKRIPVLLRIFSNIIKYEPQARLFLFTNYEVPFYVGFDILGLIEDYGLEDYVYLPKTDTLREPYTIQQMVDLYNASDCYISTSQGEGFCLPVVESMACGLPVIAPKNSTMHELLNNGKNGWLVDNVPDHMIRDDMFGIPTRQSYPLPDEYLFRKQILHVIRNRNKLIKKGQSARVFVCEHYDWKIIMPMWKRLLYRQIEKIVIKSEIKNELQKQLKQ